MDVVIDIVAFAAVISSAVVAGGQLFCWVALLPALAGWTIALISFVHRDAMTDRPHHFLRVFAIIMMLSSVTLLVLLIVDDDSWLAIAIVAVGVAAGIVSSGISSREWPINEEIKSWGDSPKVDRYPELRHTWDYRHVRRTWLSTLALAAFIVATLVSDSI